MDNNNPEQPIGGLNTPDTQSNTLPKMPTEQPKPQQTEQPLSPAVEQPISPVTEQPMAPIADQPIAPAIEQPITPIAEQPLSPVAEQPVGQPSVQAPIQPTNTPFAQPIEQPPIQPVMPPVMNEQPATEGNISAPKAKKNTKNIILGLVSGAVIAVVVAALIIFLPKGGKTVSCTANQSMMGIEIESTINIRVGDGKLLGGDSSTMVNLKNMSTSYKDMEDDLVDSILDSYKGNCEEHCKFNHDYVKGDYIKLNMEYDEEGIDSLTYTYGLENKSAQEIADMVQDNLESYQDAVCKQY